MAKYLGMSEWLRGAAQFVTPNMSAQLEKAAQEIEQLRAELTAAREHIERLSIALNDCLGCISAARIEGLDDALANTPDERLRDLVERRLLWVEKYAAIEQAGGGV